jgi:prevent-host-death family protein
MVMIMTNIHEAKAKLTEFLEAAARGERVLICKRNRPVAELRAVESARTAPRPVGAALPGFAVPPSFFEPLADDLLDAFDSMPAERGVTRVAETKSTYPLPRRRRKARS